LNQSLFKQEGLAKEEKGNYRKMGLRGLARGRGVERI